MALAGLTDRRHAGNTGIFGCQMRAGARAAFHAVNIDRIRVAFDRHAHIIIDPRCAQLELDRDLPIGGFADFLNLQRQIVRAQPIRVARRRTLVNAGGNERISAT